MVGETFEKILTPQEHILLGSGTFLEEEIGEGINWYKPEAIAERTLESVAGSRQRRGWYEGSMLGVLLGVQHIAIKLSELDSKTGETLSDPVIGVRDESTGEYVERSDLTELLFHKLKEVGIDPHLREKSAEIEQESGGEAKEL